MAMVIVRSLMERVKFAMLMSHQAVQIPSTQKVPQKVLVLDIHGKHVNYKNVSKSSNDQFSEFNPP